MINKYQNALLSSFLEQVWESRLIFISLSVFSTMYYTCRSWIIYNAYFELELYICIM